MAYDAKVIPIMIASPSDVSDERRAARDVILEWNYVHSLASGVVLMPAGWETHSAPEMGSRPQDLINNRVLRDCDLLVGVFWTRLGTPTGTAGSGTVEEIQRHRAAGKPAMLYFSDRLIAPGSVDPAQYAAVKEFRAWCEQNGLIEVVQTTEDFKGKFARQLQLALSQNPYVRGILESARSAKPNAESADPGQVFSGALSPDAAAVLVAAGQGNGVILKFNGPNGRFLEAGGHELFNSQNPRDFARAEGALRELAQREMIIDRHDGNVFELTERGYSHRDRIV